MRIAPLKWTYDCIQDETEAGNWKDGVYEIYAIKDRGTTKFTVEGIQEATAQRIAGSLTGAMETQRHEFLWGLANMHNQGTLYGDDDK